MYSAGLHRFSSDFLLFFLVGCFFPRCGCCRRRHRCRLGFIAICIHGFCHCSGPPVFLSRSTDQIHVWLRYETHGRCIDYGTMGRPSTCKKRQRARERANTGTPRRQQLSFRFDNMIYCDINTFSYLFCLSVWLRHWS